MGRNIFDDIKKEPRIRDPEMRSKLEQDIEELRAYRETFRTLIRLGVIFTEETTTAFEYALGITSTTLTKLTREYEKYI